MKKIYTIVVTTALSTREIDSILRKNGMDVTMISIPDESVFPVDLIVNGQLIDSIDFCAKDERNAIHGAWEIFSSGEDYDVVPASAITLDMVQLHRE